MHIFVIFTKRQDFFNFFFVFIVLGAILINMCIHTIRHTYTNPILSLATQQRPLVQYKYKCIYTSQPIVFSLLFLLNVGRLKPQTHTHTIIDISIYGHNMQNSKTSKYTERQNTQQNAPNQIDIAIKTLNTNKLKQKHHQTSKSTQISEVKT